MLFYQQDVNVILSHISYNFPLNYDESLIQLLMLAALNIYIYLNFKRKKYTETNNIQEDIITKETLKKQIFLL